MALGPAAVVSSDPLYVKITFCRISRCCFYMLNVFLIGQHYSLWALDSEYCYNMCQNFGLYHSVSRGLAFVFLVSYPDSKEFRQLFLLIDPRNLLS